jgi:acyl-[acyl-carrier-protein] desaturase
MIYEAHLRATEENAWPLDTTIAWDAIDVGVASAEREIHQSLHDAALIEGYLPVYAARLMQLLWNDIDATAVLSMELYEGLKHFTALTRYLDRVGFQREDASAAALVAARERALAIEYREGDLIAHLTNFMCSELFAAHYFLRISRRTNEPVLRDLLGYMARDEFRHSASAGDVLRKRVDANPDVAAQVLTAAERFRHYGSDVVDVPVAEENDFEAIMAVNRKIRLVCGLAPTEHLKESIPNGD